MSVQLLYEDMMELPEGMDTRLTKYLENPGLECQSAADYRFACEILLRTAQQAYQGQCNFFHVEGAVELVLRLADGVLTDLPDLGLPGLSYSELDDLREVTQAWLEVFYVVAKSNHHGELDDPRTLQEVMRREVEYYNYRELRAQDRKPVLADLATLDLA